MSDIQDEKMKELLREAFQELGDLEAVKLNTIKGRQEQPHWVLKTMEHIRNEQQTNKWTEKRTEYADTEWIPTYTKGVTRKLERHSGKQTAKNSPRHPIYHQWISVAQKVALWILLLQLLFLIVAPNVEAFKKSMFKLIIEEQSARTILSLERSEELSDEELMDIKELTEEWKRRPLDPHYWPDGTTLTSYQYNFDSRTYIFTNIVSDQRVTVLILGDRQSIYLDNNNLISSEEINIGDTICYYSNRDGVHSIYFLQEDSLILLQTTSGKMDLLLFLKKLLR